MQNVQKYKWDTLSLGTCYYPEHWDKTLWKDDLERMKEVGIKTVRIAEFAWNKFEPTEGDFTFGFFDEFLELALKCDMKVIFCTPTATPPAWLTTKYEEVLNCNMEGTLFRHGARRHYNYNSPIYKRLSSRIVEKLAEHYGSHPAIIGWQIDNEFNCEVNEFYSHADTLAFRAFLEQRYNSLEDLNKAWGTVFWNQTYTSWDQIDVPRSTPSNSTNPHQALDFKRFISESTIVFCSMQSDILRKYIKDDIFITTNGMFGNVNNHRMTRECLDVYTYDSYPNFAYCLTEDPKNDTTLKDRKWSRNLAEVRSVCKNFGIMEQQSGANGWNCKMEAPAPKPGQMMLWTMQSIAHGADFVSFFRWRTCAMGTEIYWHGILDYDNHDNRKLAEVKKISKRVEKMANIAGSHYQADIAVLKDYSNVWDSEVDRWHMRLDKKSQIEIFVAAQITHTPLDYIYIEDDLEIGDLCQYDVLIYPHAVIMDAKRVKLLEQYVNNGGTLILGCRTGMKDETGQCPMQRMPGELAKLTGTIVKDYTFIGPSDDKSFAIWNDIMIETPIFNDVLEIKEKDVTVLATYGSNYYKEEPALVERKVGGGKVLYLGSTFSHQTVKSLLTYLGCQTPYKDRIVLPEQCEISVRKKEDMEYIFVLNYSDECQEIELKEVMTDMDTQKKYSGKIKMNAFETKVFEIKQ